MSVELQDSNGTLQQFRCVLDTGFTGYIALPAASIRQLGLTPIGPRNTTLLGIYSAPVSTYDGIAYWHGQTVEITVLETQRESVIGMALLEDSTLTVQVWDGGEVLVESR